MSPAVSVVIPAYNSEATIAATIQSVFHQTFRDFEIIVVDDGSQDGTRNEVSRVGHSIRYFWQENQGVATARNRGIAEARGRYVAFLDSDDLWLPRKLEVQLAALEKEPALSAVQCSVYLANDALQVIEEKRCHPAQDTWLDFLLFRNLPGLGSALLARKECLENLGGFGTDLVILEDWDIACRLARTGSLRSLPDFLVMYRQHTANRSRAVQIHEGPGFRSLGRVFSDPLLDGNIRSQESHIWARFYTMLAGGYIQNRQWRKGFRWAWKAVSTSPRVTGYFAAMPMRHLRRKHTAKQKVSLAFQMPFAAKPLSGAGEPGVTRSCPICRNGKPSEKQRSEKDALDLFRCKRCGMVYWGHTWSSDKVNEHYHRYYPQDSVEYDLLTEKRYHALLSRFERFKRPSRLLDIGCGTGHFLAVAEMRGWQGAGLEVSKSAIQSLERVKRERGFQFSIIEGNLTSLGLPAESFDCITLFEVIEHLDDPMAVLKEVHRLLKEGGILYLTTPNYDSLSRYLLGFKWRVIAEEHRCLFSPRTLTHCLDMFGFRSVQSTTKNIDVLEVLSKWGMCKQAYHPARPESASQRFRHSLEKRVWLRAAKSIMNRVFSLFGLGDTLEVLSVKERKVPCVSSS